MFADLLELFGRTIAPIFVLVIVGVFVERRFNLDVSSISKLLFWVLIPAILFVSFVESTLNWANIGLVLLIQSLLVVSMYGVSVATCAVLRFEKSVSASVTAAAVFANSGNFGLPLVAFVFAEQAQLALSYQSLNLLVQNLFTFTLGILVIGSGRLTLRESAKQIIRLPLLYAIMLAFLLRYLSVPIEELTVIWAPLNHAGEAIIAIGLLTLGAQLGKARTIAYPLPLATGVALRLVVGPLLAFILVTIFQVDGILRPLLIISAGAPSSVNSALIGVEFGKKPELSTSLVVVSTALSAVTVSILVFMFA